MGIQLPALSLHPVQQPDLLGGAEKAMSLSSLMQQRQMNQQIGQQNLKSGALDLAAKQRAAEDQKNIMDALTQTNGDMGKALQLLPGKVSFGSYKSLQDDYVKTLKDKVEIDQKTFDLQRAKNDQFLGLVTQAQQLPPDQYAANWPQIANSALALHPELKDKINFNQPIPQEQLPNIALGFAAQKSIFDKAEEVRKEKEFQAKLPGEQATSELKQAELKAVQSGGAAPGIPLDTQEANAWLKNNPGKDLADYGKYKATLVPAYNFNLQGGGLNNPSDPVTQSLVKQVATGKMKIGDVLTPRTPLPARKAFLGQVLAENPDFDSRSYDVEKGVMKDFTSGKSAQNLTAFNTAIEHSKQLQGAADALQNGDMPTLNKIGNALGYQFASDKTTNFNVIKNALSGEISKVFKGGQATDAEIKEVQGPFDAANSPAQLKGAINNAIKLMNSKRDALKQQYEAGREGKPNFGENGGTVYARDPQGKLHQAPAGTALPAGWKPEKTP